MIDIPGTKVQYNTRHLMISAFLTLTKGQGSTTRSKVTDVEMSAFSECFLLIYLLIFEALKLNSMYNYVILSEWFSDLKINCVDLLSKDFVDKYVWWWPTFNGSYKLLHAGFPGLEWVFLLSDVGRHDFVWPPVRKR